MGTISWDLLCGITAVEGLSFLMKYLCSVDSFIFLPSVFYYFNYTVRSVLGKYRNKIKGVKKSDFESSDAVSFEVPQ